MVTYLCCPSIAVRAGQRICAGTAMHRGTSTSTRVENDRIRFVHIVRPLEIVNDGVRMVHSSGGDRPLRGRSEGFMALYVRA
jgi:hypothetical protein